MKYCFITFRSVTPAQRGEKTLRRTGVECTVHRTPRWMEQQGCGYSLRLRHQDIVNGIAVLQENGISYRKIYLQRENGVYEELVL